MPPLQQSLTISLLRVALWWQKWQRLGDFNTFHVIFGAEMQFFSSFFFLLRCLLAPVKVPSSPVKVPSRYPLHGLELLVPWGGATRDINSDAKLRIIKHYKAGAHRFFLQKSLVVPNKSRTFAPTVPATPPNNAYHGGTSSFIRV